MLEDIDPVPLPRWRRWPARSARPSGAKATFATTTDQKKALDGADFVIVTISTGGFESMAVDIDVPARYGIRQSVADTVGPGGINRALRNVPVLVGIARDIEEVSPDAWLLNITNPMTCLTRAVCRRDVGQGGRPVPRGGQLVAWTWPSPWASRPRRSAPRSPGSTTSRWSPRSTSTATTGSRSWPRWSRRPGASRPWPPIPGRPQAETFSRLDFVQRHALKLALLDRWGAFPAAGDRHVAEFLPWVLTEESDWGADFNIELTTIETREGHQDGSTSPTSTPGWPGPRTSRPGSPASCRLW